MQRGLPIVKDYYIRTATLRTCVNVYDHLRTVHPFMYRKAASNGVDITVQYADYCPPNNKYDKLIIAIHGGGDDYRSFNPIGEYFVSKNIRFIAPNLPDFLHSRQTKTFFHSTIEKGQFLKDFLRFLNIKHIDCLCSHSLGVQTISGLWIEPEEFQIKTVALLSPQSFKTNISNFEWKKKIIRAIWFNSELWFQFLEMLQLHKSSFLAPMKFENINSFLLLCCTFLHDDMFATMAGRLRSLAKQQVIPYVLLYGDQDGLIPQEAVKRLIELLEISDRSQINLSDNVDDSLAIQMFNQRMFYRVINGRHFVHWTHPHYAIAIIESLLRYQ